MTPTADEIQNQEHKGLDRRMVTFLGVLAAFFWPRSTRPSSAPRCRGSSASSTASTATRG